MSMVKSIAGLMLVPFLALGVTACSSNNTSPNNAENPVATETKKSYPNNVIDIRDPEEYYAGHLDQSINLPYSDEAIFSSVVGIMNKELIYEIYGSSQEQVSEVVDRLEFAGFTSIKNLGTLDEASEQTGLEIIQ
jgi:phage shock protein E